MIVHEVLRAGDKPTPEQIHEIHEVWEKKFNLYDTDCRGRVNIVDKHIEL